MAIVDIEHLAMRSRPFGDVQNDLEEATFSKGDRVRVKGWVQLDGGPKWFYVERSEAQFLWVSGYVFQKGEAVRTLKVDDGCPLGDIYTNDFYMDPPEGIPRLAQLSSWETSTAPCMCKIVFDMVKVYDTPFEPYQGERNYGKLNVGDEVRVIGWYQEDEGTKWFQISSAEQVFWIKGTEYHADGDKLVIKANPACEVANIYDEKYRLIQPLRDAEQ